MYFEVVRGDSQALLDSSEGHNEHDETYSVIRKFVGVPLQACEAMLGEFALPVLRWGISYQGLGSSCVSNGFRI